MQDLSTLPTQGRRRFLIGPRTPAPGPVTPARTPSLVALPAEIRQYIFELALGGHMIHLGVENLPVSIFRRERWTRKNAQGVLRRYHCSQGDDLDAWLHPCWFPFAPSRPPDPPLNLLGLPLTCRALHADALAALYTFNTFDMASPEVLRDLGRYMPAKNVARIRSLRLLIKLSEFPSRNAGAQAAYDAAWRALRVPQGLCELRVLLWLPVCSQELWRDNEDTFLHPVRGMNGLDHLEYGMPALGFLTPGAVTGNSRMRGYDELRILGSCRF